MSELFKKDIPVVAPEFRIPRNSSTPVVYNGNQARQIAVATFDPSADSTKRAVGAYGLGVYIPDNAVITSVIIDVVTTFASAGADAGTIALHAQTANDIVSAIAISDATNVWDAGVRGSKVGFPAIAGSTASDTSVEVAALFAGSMLKLTADREITATVAVQALTAGKMNVFVEYFISD